MQHFIWQPKHGIDADALARMRAHFRCPKAPMGEAWFMGEKRHLFHELQGDLADLTAWDLQKALEEISSGTSSFGPRDEWNDWYHYLLASTVQRAHEDFVSSLLESLVTGFMALYPNGIVKEPYPGFEQDVLLTLGCCMMEPRCWSGEQIVVGSFLHRSDNNPNRIWCWWNASGDFTASMFFCLKYLPASLVSEWFSSVLAIKSPHWRAQVVVWLVGANDMLRGQVKWPADLPAGAYPSVEWDWSHCLGSDLASSDASDGPAAEALLPCMARTRALETVYSYFTETVFLEWLDSLSSVPYLESELAKIPSTFEHLYVRRG